VATFGERVVDVIDLTGAQITSPTRQAAIKRALLPLSPRKSARSRRRGDVIPGPERSEGARNP